MTSMDSTSRLWHLQELRDVVLRSATREPHGLIDMASADKIDRIDREMDALQRDMATKISITTWIDGTGRTSGADVWHDGRCVQTLTGFLTPEGAESAAHRWAAEQGLRIETLRQ